MRRSFIAGLAAAAALLSAGGAGAQKYKDAQVPGTINVVVAYAAGGGTDILVRTALPYLEAAIQELSGKKPNIVVKNMPGAGGEVGWSAMARAPADGSTIGIINLPAIAIVEAARKPPYAPFTEKFAPIGVNVVDPNIIRVNDQYKSLKEAIEAGKKEPGSVTLGADGPLSDDHLAVYAVQEGTGTTFTFIPYSGSAPANRAFLSKEVGVTMGNVTDYLQTEEASVDAAILADERYELVPNVPTFKERVGVDVTTGGSTRGWVATAGTPEPLLALYREAFAKASKDPKYIEEAKKRNLTLVEPRVGEAFGKMMTKTSNDVQSLLKYFKQGGYLK